MCETLQEPCHLISGGVWNTCQQSCKLARYWGEMEMFPPASAAVVQKKHGGRICMGPYPNGTIQYCWEVLTRCIRRRVAEVCPH